MTADTQNTENPDETLPTSTTEVEVEKHSETEDVVGLCDTALKPGLFVEGSFDDKYHFHIGEIALVHEEQTCTVSFMTRLKKSGTSKDRYWVFSCCRR